ncbi:hypothetical protein MP638_004494 [Amoeboaphelidium occidentale]|nr:hypothetical protein MP638_004494 [Amoeboaphelidium occidentale]
MVSASKNDKKRILVTGATGNAGCSMIKTLCETEMQNFIIRAGVRRDSVRKELLNEFPCLEVSSYDAAQLDESLYNAMRDVDYLYLVTPNTSTRVQQVKNYIQAAKDCDVSAIVLFSMLRPSKSLPGQTPKRYHQEYEAIEALVEQSGIPYVFLRAALQHQTLFLFVPDIWKGVLPLPWGNGRISMINMLDVSKAACRVLRDPLKHDRRAFHLTGRESLSAADIAQVASKAFRIDVRPLEITLTSLKKLLVDSGLENWLADEFIEMFEEIRAGLFNEVDTHDLLETMINGQAYPLQQFFADHAERFVNYNPAVPPLYGPPEGIGEVSSAVTAPSATIQPEPFEIVPPAEKPIQMQQVGEKVDYEQKYNALVSVVCKCIDEKKELISHLRDMVTIEGKRLSDLVEEHKSVACGAEHTS